MSKGSELRQLIKNEPYIFTSGVYTPIQAKIAEMVGLKVVYVSGYSCVIGHLARADLGFATLTEMTSWAKAISTAVDVPVISDADDGYGNALIVTRTIEEFEKAGVAAIHIEDQRFPKRCGHLAGKYCLPIQESEMKIRAALDSRSDKDFFIIARTDAMGAVGGSKEEAIERCKRYAHAGADCIWPEFPTPNRRDAEMFAQTIQKDYPGLPMLFNYSSSFRWIDEDEPLTFSELGEMGYKIIVVSLGAIHASMFAEWNFLKDLSDNQEIAQLNLQRLKDGHPTENHHEMGRFEHFRELERKYVPSDIIEERYSGTTGYGSYES